MYPDLVDHIMISLDMKNVFPLIIICASVNLEGFVFSGSVQGAGLENI